MRTRILLCGALLAGGCVKEPPPRMAETVEEEVAPPAPPPAPEAAGSEAAKPAPVPAEPPRRSAAELAAYADSLVGKTEAELVKAKGRPLGAITAGAMRVLSWEDVDVTVGKGVVVAANPKASLPPPPSPARTQAAPPVRAVPVKIAPSSEADRDVLFAEARRKARERAYRYYRYEHQGGSRSMIVTSLRIDLDDPEFVAGWGGRIRVSGTAGYDYYTSSGGSFNRRTSRFEVQLDPTGDGTLRITDFGVK